jgi:hypothetical protein
MELLERRVKDKRLKVHMLVDVAVQIADALDAAHSKDHPS